MVYPVVPADLPSTTAPLPTQGRGHFIGADIQFLKQGVTFSWFTPGSAGLVRKNLHERSELFPFSRAKLACVFTLGSGTAFVYSTSKQAAILLFSGIELQAAET